MNRTAKAKARERWHHGSRPMGDASTTLDSQSRRALLVLGMHRSGTSAVTRMLNLLGADLPSQLMPSVSGVNEVGFWEPMDLVAIDNEVLTSGGSSWDDVSPFPVSWYESSAAKVCHDKVLRTLRRDFPHSSLFVLKDPRICRLVPFWIKVLEAFGAEPSFVIPIRNPIDVAASLKARDGFPVAKSHLLWLRHLLDAELGTRGHRRTFITYDFILDNWRSTAEKISRELGIVWPRQSRLAAAEIGSFLSTRHRHHTTGDEEVAERSDVGGWVKRAFFVARAAAEGESEGLTQAFDAIRGDFEGAEEHFGPYVAAQRVESANARAKARQLEDRNNEDERHTSEIARLGDELVATHRKAQEVGDLLVQRSKELEEKAHEANRLRAQIEAAKEEVAWLRVQNSRLAEDNGRLAAHLEITGQEVSRLVAVIDQAHSLYRDVQAHASRLEAKVELVRRIPLAKRFWRFFHT